MRADDGADATPASDPLSRRAFLDRAARLAAAGALGLLGAPAIAGCARRASHRPPWPAAPLRLPPVLSAHGGATLTARPFDARPAAGVPFGGWGYDGGAPGPTIEARRGASLDVTLRNLLPQPTTVHWHGLASPPAMDGQPMQLVAPGESFRYAVPITQRARTMWYHPHPHGRTAEQTARGLAGLLIVRDDEEDALCLPAGRHELPLVLRDTIDRGDRALGHRRWLVGFRGDVPLVNGTVRPVTAVEPTHYRLRIVNAATARVFRLHLSDVHPVWLLGNDGGLLPAAVPVREVTIGPAERVDLLLDLSGARAGERVVLSCREADWTLLTLVVVPRRAAAGARAPATPWVPPRALATVAALRAAPHVVHRTFRFGGLHVNGHRWDMSRVAFTVPRHSTERWRFVAGLGAPHPVHVHGAHFQVEQRLGGRGCVFPWEGGWMTRCCSPVASRWTCWCASSTTPGRTCCTATSSSTRTAA